MSDMWTGEKVRLRGVEPGDWEGFRSLARDTVDVRNAGLVEPHTPASRRALNIEPPRRPRSGPSRP